MWGRCFQLSSRQLHRQSLRYDVLNEKRKPAIGHSFVRGFLPNGGHPLVLFRWKLGPNRCVANRCLVGLLDVTVRCSLMQSPWTLREAETKKGRCSVSGNGPLTFPRQLDVVADAANVARTRFAGPRISELRGKLKTTEHSLIFANKTDAPISCQEAVCGSVLSNSHRSS